MVEALYGLVVRTLRQFVNVSRKEERVDSAEGLLKSLITRMDFLLKSNEKNVPKEELVQELKKLSNSLFVKTNNPIVYQERMRKGIERLKWTNLKYKINTSGRKYTVAQREIFYANLGENVGSEQNGRRPVIILQNNIGNRKGNTTIIAPITTHQKSIVEYDTEKRRYYIERFCDGVCKRKYLGSYEVPLILEENEKRLQGVVNVMHLREIDRKRIDSRKLGIATEQCFEQVIKAINRNFRE